MMYTGKMDPRYEEPIGWLRACAEAAGHCKNVPCHYSNMGKNMTTKPGIGQKNKSSKVL